LGLEELGLEFFFFLLCPLALGDFQLQLLTFCSRLSRASLKAASLRFDSVISVTTRQKLGGVSWGMKARASRTGIKVPSAEISVISISLRPRVFDASMVSKSARSRGAIIERISSPMTCSRGNASIWINRRLQ